METLTDIQILNLQWGENLKFSIFKMVLLTIILFIGLLVLFSFANFDEIIKNWSRYRCNPAFMPFAGIAGYNATDNFKFCLDSIFGEKARELFAPIFALIGNFVKILKLMVDVSLGFRQMFGRFFLGMNGYIRNVRDRIQAVMFQIRMSFLKLQNLMGRVYATMFSVVFMGMSAVTAGLNLSENSLVSFVLDFCFAPETPVQLANGQIKAIGSVKVGDNLKGGRVTSTFVLNGSKTPMVRIENVQMSADHLVWGPNKSWILAKDHPSAIPIPSIPFLICLNVDSHQFYVGDRLLVRDYDETDAESAVHISQKMAEKALNGKLSETSPIDKYELGISPNAYISLEDKTTWIHAHDVKIGTRLYGDNEVMGIVQEKCTDVRLWKGIEVSGAQLIEHDGQWVRAAHLTKNQDSPQILIQFITRKMTPFPITSFPENPAFSIWVRDYREVALPEMEDAYREAIDKEKIE